MFCAFTVIILVSMTALVVIFTVIPSIYSINSVCNSSNLTIGEDQSMIISEYYFKNLNSDNPQLAELICQDILNQTAK